MKLFFRLWVSATGVVAFVSIFFVGLATLQFNQIHVGLVADRLAVVADNAASPFEAAARIGLPLSSVRTSEALLEKARQSDSQILAVHLYDADGQILQSTNPSAELQVDTDIWKARLGADGPSWHHEDSDWIWAGQDILSLSGSSVGGVIIVYSSALSHMRVWAMAAEMLAYSVAIILLATVLIGAVLRVGLARAIASFDETDQSLADFDSGLRIAHSGSSADDQDAERPETLRAMLKAARQSYLSAAKHLGTKNNTGDV